MKSTLFRFAWWLARKTAPSERYSVTMVHTYNDGSIAYNITLGAFIGDDDADALRELSEDLGGLSDDIRQKAAERQLDLEIEAALAAHEANNVPQKAKHYNGEDMIGDTATGDV